MFDSCEAAEEDYTAYDRLARRQLQSSEFVVILFYCW